MRHMRYITVRTLMAFRGLVKLITSLLIAMGIIGLFLGIEMPLRPGEAAAFVAFIVIPFLIRIFYDKLIWKVAPKGMDIYLD